MTTATVCLALVGVMAVRMTPAQTPHGDALRSVSTSVLTGTSNSINDIAGAAANSGRRFTDVVGRTLTSMIATTDRTVASSSSTPALLAPSDAELAVVTPIAQDRLGITTAAAVEGRTGTIEAMLPTGVRVIAELLGTDDGFALVRLPARSTEAAAIAKTSNTDWTVIAYGDEHAVDQGGRALHSMAIPEAAPVFNADGDLIGLCTIGPNGIEVLRVAALPDVPGAPTEPSEPRTTVAVSEPVTSGGPPVESEPPAAPASTATESTVLGSSVPVTDSSAVATTESPETSVTPTSDVPTT